MSSDPEAADTAAPSAQSARWRATVVLLEHHAGRSPASVSARLGACQTLSGCLGRRALEALVAGLDDNARSVRVAAGLALAASACRPGGAGRLALAVFHRRPDVRLDAVLRPSLSPSLLVEAFADPIHGNGARAVARTRAPQLPALGAAIVAGRRRGLVADDDARTILAALPWHSQAMAIVRALPAPKAPAAAPGLEAQLATLGDDHLIDVLSLAAHADDGSAGAEAEATLLAALLDGMGRAIVARHADDDDRRRFALAVVVAATMVPPVDPALLALAATGLGAVWTHEALDLDVRRQACRSLAWWRGTCRSPLPLQGFRQAGLLHHAGGHVDVDAVAGALRACGDRPFEQLRAAVPLADVARAFALRPRAALLSLPPAGTLDRAAYTALIAAIGTAMAERSSMSLFSTVMSTSGAANDNANTTDDGNGANDDGPDDHEHRVDIPALVDVVLSLPADGLPLFDALQQAPADLLPRILAAVVDREHLGGHDDDVGHRRITRSLDALARRCGVTTLAGIVRLAMDRIMLTEGSVADVQAPRAVVAAVARTLSLGDLAQIIDGLGPDRLDRALAIVVDEAPSVWTEGALPIVRQHPASPTVQALSKRDAPPTDIADDPVLGDPVTTAAAFAERVLVLANRQRIRGVASLLQRHLEMAVDADPWRSPSMAAAILLSHDSITSADKALGLTWPRSSPTAQDDTSDTDSEVSRIMQARSAAALWPFHAALFGPPHVVAPRTAQALSSSPTGLKGLLELCLSLTGPLGPALANALAATMAEVVAGDAARARTLLGPAVMAVLLDVDSGVLLDDTDPRRPAFGRLLKTARAVHPQPPPPPTAPPPTAGDHQGLLESASDDDFTAWVHEASDDDLNAVAASGLCLGVSVSRGHRLEHIVRRLPPSKREPLVLEALRSTDDADGLKRWLALLPITSSMSSAMGRLREIAGWGARQGLAICHARFGISFIADSLGYTRLSAHRIFVNPLPMLTGQQGGDDIVRGLMIHEFGHHRFHADEAARAIWEQARTEQLHQLLNLVADEHLERNLRAEAPRRWGAPLKTLAAWAFQHMHKEFPLEKLLTSLGPRAFAVLSGQPLGVGRGHRGVVVDVGTALTALSAQGSSLARFIRVLRMGKADATGDPRVQQAMALFPAHRFRSSTMAELMAITRQLREIFADDVGLLGMLDFHGLTEASAADLAADGVDGEDLDVTPGVRPRRRFSGPTPRGPGAAGGTGALNDGADLAFDDITTVERVTADAVTHRSVAVTVRRPAAILRASLRDFGTTDVVERRRLSGRRVDRSGLVQAVIRGDPRLLAARRTVPSPDVFIGVLIDCSGSMAGDNLERAKHFAVVIAEAARGLPAVDARFFGFTDTVIFDAGTARRCGVTALEADGGNNDAAALAWAARAARHSRRQTVLLVMISDGAPTECSIDALRALVRSVSARGMLCAQVAIETLDDGDICFDHHIVLDDGDLDGASRRFGAVIERLLHLTRAR